MERSDRRSAGLEDLAATGGRDMPVDVLDYDPSWPTLFEAERLRLSRLLVGAEIHHVGSTAVPGLAAKPIIDIAVLVGSYEPAVRRLVEEAGYQYPRAFNATLSCRRFLCYPTPQARTHHVHLVDDPARLARFLSFRDRLRSDEALAREYEALKRELAARHRDDREAYTEAKSQFVRDRAAPGARGVAQH